MRPGIKRLGEAALAGVLIVTTFTACKRPEQATTTSTPKGEPTSTEPLGKIGPDVVPTAVSNFPAVSTEEAIVDGVEDSDPVVEEESEALGNPVAEATEEPIVDGAEEVDVVEAIEEQTLNPLFEKINEEAIARGADGTMFALSEEISSTLGIDNLDWQTGDIKVPAVVESYPEYQIPQEDATPENPLILRGTETRYWVYPGPDKDITEDRPFWIYSIDIIKDTVEITQTGKFNTITVVDRGTETTTHSLASIREEREVKSSDVIVMHNFYMSLGGEGVGLPFDANDKIIPDADKTTPLATIYPGGFMNKIIKEGQTIDEAEDGEWHPLGYYQVVCVHLENGFILVRFIPDYDEDGKLVGVHKEQSFIPVYYYPVNDVQ